MQPNDLTIDILKSIRGEIQTTNAKLDELRASTEGRFERVEGRLDRSERRQADTEIRLATEIVAVADAVREVRDLLREDRVLVARVEDHEQRLRAIESRAG